MSADEISTDTRFWLVKIQDDVRHAIEGGIAPELVLDAVVIGLEQEHRAAGWATSPLALSLTRAFNSAVGPMGGHGPTAVLDTSTGPAADVAAESPVHAAGSPGPVEATASYEEIGGDECGDLLPGDENLPLARHRGTDR